MRELTLAFSFENTLESLIALQTFNLRGRRGSTLELSGAKPIATGNRTIHPAVDLSCIKTATSAPAGEFPREGLYNEEEEEEEGCS